jgi:hypothetical protein
MAMDIVGFTFGAQVIVRTDTALVSNTLDWRKRASITGYVLVDNAFLFTSFVS